MSLTAEEMTEAVFSLYERGGKKAYLGEEVTQLEHAIQCAMLAEQEGWDNQVRVSLGQEKK